MYLLRVFSGDVSARVRVRANFRYFRYHLLIILNNARARGAFCASRIQVSGPFRSPLVTRRVDRRFLINDTERSICHVMEDRGNAYSLLRHFPREERMFEGRLTRAAVNAESIVSKFKCAMYHGVLRYNVRVLPIVLRFALRSLRRDRSRSNDRR